MANSSIDPGRREDDLEEAEGASGPGVPDEQGIADAAGGGAGERRTPAGATDGDEPGWRGEEAADETVPALEGSAIDNGQGHAGAHGADEEDHGARGGFAATALKILVFILVIVGLSLWLLPNVAPHLPAALGRHLMAGQADLDQRLAALSDRIEASTSRIAGDVSAMREEVAQLKDSLATAEQTAEQARAEAEAAKAAAAKSASAAEQNAVAQETVGRAEKAAQEASGEAETATTAATEAGKVAAAATRDTASLARRMTEFESRLASLSDQLEAINESLASGGGEGEAAAPELTAAVAGLKAQVGSLHDRLENADYLTAAEADRFATQDDLRSARTALAAQIDQAMAKLPQPGTIATKDEVEALRSDAEARVGKVIERLDGMQSAVTEAAQSAEAAQQAATAAVGKVDEAIRRASLRSAGAALTSRLTNGQPYASALGEVRRLVDAAPPPELAGPAETGVATAAELLRQFGPAARRAQEAEIEATSGGGVLAQARARLHSVVSGRPASEEPGESVDAILSRVEARLRDDSPAEALAEAEKLPAPAKQALGDWLDALKTRVAAATAAETYLGPVAGSQG